MKEKEKRQRLKELKAIYPLLSTKQYQKKCLCEMMLLILELA